MAIPDYQSIMLPLLKFLSDGKEHLFREAIDHLADSFRLTPEERKEPLPSGQQALFDNRVGWARTYLKKAGLLESTAWGKFRITKRGLDVLKTNPTHIDQKFLRQFPEFVEFQRPTRKQDPDPQGEEEKTETPEEMLESSYQSLKRTLSQDLLERIKMCSPRFFEKLVVDLLVAMGYGGTRKDAGEAVGRTGDGGIDGIIKEDKLGFDVVYVQAKRWEGTVGGPIVRAFAGSLEGQKARKGVLITTSHFSQDAQDYVNRIEKKIVLVDGDQLAQLMIEHGIGTTQVATYDVKKIDLDYFDEE